MYLLSAKDLDSDYVLVSLGMRLCRRCGGGGEGGGQELEGVKSRCVDGWWR